MKTIFDKEFDEAELSLDEVEAWKEANKETSMFAKHMEPIHFVGYTEDEINGIALDRDELSKELSLDE